MEKEIRFLFLSSSLYGSISHHGILLLCVFSPISLLVKIKIENRKVNSSLIIVIGIFNRIKLNFFLIPRNRFLIFVSLQIMTMMMMIIRIVLIFNDYIDDDCSHEIGNFMSKTS